MIRMNVYRHNRNERDDMNRIIEYMWMNPGKIIYRDAVGVAVESSESISNSFLMVKDMCGANLNVRIHVMELCFEKSIISLEDMIRTVQTTLLYFGKYYQCFVVVEETENGYSSKFGINACSYNGIGKFVDNNAAYIWIKDMIFSMTDIETTFSYGKTVLFYNQNNNKCNYASVAD